MRSNPTTKLIFNFFLFKHVKLSGNLYCADIKNASLNKFVRIRNRCTTTIDKFIRNSHFWIVLRKLIFGITQNFVWRSSLAYKKASNGFVNNGNIDFSSYELIERVYLSQIKETENWKLIFKLLTKAAKNHLTVYFNLKIFYFLFKCK